MSLNTRLPDFDMLAALHRQDAEAFEAFRRHLLREAVDEAPPAYRPALEKLLSRIEAVHAAAATPMEAALAAARMMQDSVLELRNAWVHARHAAVEFEAALIVERLRH